MGHPSLTGILTKARRTLNGIRKDTEARGKRSANGCFTHKADSPGGSGLRQSSTNTQRDSWKDLTVTWCVLFGGQSLPSRNEVVINRVGLVIGEGG